MFGLKNLFNVPATQSNRVIPAPKPLISDADLAAVVDVLATVGLDRECDYGFAYHVTKADNYRSGSLEWTIRERGIRYFIHKPLWADEITRITVVKHGFTSITDEQIENANQALISILD